MNIIGCDLHTRYQVVAWVDEESGEIRTRRLEHGKEEVQAFYVGWPRGARIGIEATFPALWFERLLAECGHELWVGDAAQIRAKAVRRQKTDTRDAEHLLDLLRTNRFPRIWVPPAAERDLRQLLVHRMKLVRIRIYNGVGRVKTLVGTRLLPRAGGGVKGARRFLPGVYRRPLTPPPARPYLIRDEALVLFPELRPE